MRHDGMPTEEEYEESRDEFEANTEALEQLLIRGFEEGVIAHVYENPQYKHLSTDPPLRRVAQQVGLQTEYEEHVKDLDNARIDPIFERVATERGITIEQDPSF